MSLGPAKPESLSALPSIADASAHFQRGQLAEAETICNAILSAQPQDFDGLHLLGLLRHRQGRNAEALRLVAGVLKRAPRSAEVLNNYGLILGALERHEEALACFEDALAHCADYPLALRNRAASLKTLQRHDEALAAFAAVLAAQPGNIDAMNECGGLLLRLGCPDAAIACYDRALAIAPGVVELHINKGSTLAAANRFAEALESFAAAAAIAPQRGEAHYKASLIHLRRGDFKRGWRDYEWRWRTERAPQVRPVAAPLWLGEAPLEGKTILLLAEQGFGDTLQFIRYAPLVAARGATVLLDVPPALKALAASVPGVSAVFGQNEPVPPVDFYCPLLSLPLAFRTELATVPSNVPYLRAREDRVMAWRSRMPQGSGLRVGICWAGSKDHLNDHNRSIALERFAEIFSLPNLDFVSLQKDVTELQLATLRKHGVVALGQDFADFADTAAVLAQLDLFISVDTSVAHLAGAMGKAVALLLPFPAEWRWLGERADSPWYPTTRLFRQTTTGDWDGPLAQLYEELSAVAGRKRAG